MPARIKYKQTKNILKSDEMIGNGYFLRTEIDASSLTYNVFKNNKLCTTRLS